ncbi:hypothetical protein AVEN_89128-1 [Araneus ventricosus]|uniref:Uncharacterized protein n=1 Tax=Araneus ventricosus TaxID=182803 RepID=A0A4Y2B448_ARAVE|nr:hypothetical protein AVEN_89128-1 [Araneus ventricosus]
MPSGELLLFYDSVQFISEHKRSEMCVPGGTESRIFGLLFDEQKNNARICVGVRMAELWDQRVVGSRPVSPKHHRVCVWRELSLNPSWFERPSTGVVRKFGEAGVGSGDVLDICRDLK